MKDKELKLEDVKAPSHTVLAGGLKKKIKKIIKTENKLLKDAGTNTSKINARSQGAVRALCRRAV